MASGHMKYVFNSGNLAVTIDSMSISYIFTHIFYCMNIDLIIIKITEFQIDQFCRSYNVISSFPIIFNGFIGEGSFQIITVMIVQRVY